MIDLDPIREYIEAVRRGLKDGSLGDSPVASLAILEKLVGQARLLINEVEWMREHIEIIQLHWKCCMRCHLVWHDPKDEIPCPRCNPAPPPLDRCEHGVPDGDWCPACREDYRRAMTLEGEDE